MKTSPILNFTLFCLGLGMLSPSLFGFAYFPYGVDQALKWGDNTVGTPGGLVTWSIMPDGTQIDASFTDPNFSGTSNITQVFDQVGGFSAAFPIIQEVFAKWSAAANIQFVQVSDSGAAFNSSGANPPDTGQIRLGAFNISGNVGAVGYAPPPNGNTSLEGDVLFNLNSHFQIAAGNEGDAINYFPDPFPDNFFKNDFEGLLLHEVGHALGLAHPAAGVQAVMSNDPAIYANINRILDADDVNGIQTLYGIPEPSQWALFIVSAGLLVLPARVQLLRKRNAAVH